MSQSRGPNHSINSSNLADLLERVLDKGVVIAGDIKVKIVDIELLTIQVRLVICSVDKAREMGMDWWVNHPLFSPQKTAAPGLPDESVLKLQERVSELEERLRAQSGVLRPAPPPPTTPPWAA